MQRLISLQPSGAIFSLTILLTLAVCAQPASESLKEGDTTDLDGRMATLKKLESLPHVENKYTKRFKFDSFDNPKLAELRERHRLDEVVAPGKDEFERQVLLLDWTHRQFKRFGRPSTNCHGALAILRIVYDGLNNYREALLLPGSCLPPRWARRNVRP